ncbi:MAG: TetR/AcrR family transcriptional regulator [Hyphomonas sp.]|nr:TetR/AcrR family transcriptional regulator [Hyphomonas sp.]
MDAKEAAVDSANTPASNLSKDEKLERLSRSAIEIFSRQGFEGTSLRDIASHAGVQLSMIDRYFGSKVDLFNEIQRCVWREINAHRLELLEKPVSVNSDGRPTLEAVLHAVIYPVVMRAVGDEIQAPMVRLLRENTSMRVHNGLKRGPKRALRSEFWAEALREACPELTPDQVVWSLSFVISTMYTGQLLDGWLDDLMPSTAPDSADRITQMMVQFCDAGIRRIAGT